MHFYYRFYGKIKEKRIQVIFKVIAGENGEKSNLKDDFKLLFFFILRCTKRFVGDKIVGR